MHMPAVLSYNQASARYESRGAAAHQASIDREEAIANRVDELAMAEAAGNSPLGVQTRLELIESVWKPEKRDELLGLLVEAPEDPRTKAALGEFRKALQRRAAADLSVHPAIFDRAEREYDARGVL